MEVEGRRLVYISDGEDTMTWIASIHVEYVR